MKKILFLFLIFNIFYVVPSYSVENYVNGNENVICATNASGAILVKEEASPDLSSFALASDPDNFNLLDKGTINNVENVDMGASCDITPDNYKMTFFKLGFCTENPYREFDDIAGNTKVANLTSCATLFDNGDGKEVNLKPGEDVDLLEGDIVVPLGVYPYQFAIIDNRVHIKHTQEFINTDGSDAEILGYNPDPNDLNDAEHQGTVCYTSTNDSGKKFVSVQSNELSESGGATTLRGFDLPTRLTGIQPSALFRCRDAVGSGVDALDWFTTILNSFGSPMCTYEPEGSCTRDESKFRNAGKQDAPFHTSFPDISQSYYLLKDDNTIATDPDDVTRILWIQHDPNNIVNITDITTGIKMNFKTNNAMQMQIHQDANNPTVLMANQIHGGTIIGNIQTKTKRRRGAWR